MLGIIHRMYDLTPNSPVTVTDGVTVACSNVNTIYPIGSEYVRHAFIVLQDADIVVKNAANQTLQRGTDYFTIARAMDNDYSKKYNTSIYSGIQFKATGTYTVTSFITCGTYPRAEWFNYLMEQLIYVRDVTVAALSEAVNSLTTKVNDMLSTVTEHSVTLADHGTRIFTAETDIDVLQDRCTTIEAVNTTQSSNISTLQTNLTNHTSLTSTAHGATSAATANTIIARDADGRAQVANPSADNDIANKSYVDSKVVAAGGGDVISATDTSVGGHVVTYNDDYGHTINDSGYAIGNASGNIPLSNLTENLGLISQQSRLLFNRPSSDTNSILDMALSDFTTYGIGLHYYSIPSSDPARPWTVNSHAVLMGYPNYARLIAFKLNSKAIAIRLLLGGTWETAWTYLTDDNGTAMAANNVYMNPSGASLQSGTMTSNAAVTANYSGFVTITATNYSGSFGAAVTMDIDNITVFKVWCDPSFNIVNTFPIRQGQTFRFAGVTGSYIIKASK